MRFVLAFSCDVMKCFFLWLHFVVVVCRCGSCKLGSDLHIHVCICPACDAFFFIRGTDRRSGIIAILSEISQAPPVSALQIHVVGNIGAQSNKSGCDCLPRRNSTKEEHFPFSSVDARWNNNRGGSRVEGGMILFPVSKNSTNCMHLQCPIKFYLVQLGVKVDTRMRLVLCSCRHN